MCKNHIFSYIIFIAFSVLAVADLAARGDGGIKKYVAENYEVSFFVEPIVGGSHYTHFRGMSDSVDFTIVTSSKAGITLAHVSCLYSTMSPSLEIKGSRHLAVYVGQLDEEQISTKEPVAELMIPVAAQSALIHMIPKGQLSFSSYVYDITGTRFNPGDGEIVNSTKWEVAANVGGERLRILPQGRGRIDLSTVKRYRLEVQLLVKEGDEWEWVYNSRKAVNPSGKILLLLYQKPGRGQFAVRFLELDPG